MTPEEQVILFGDQGAMNRFSHEAFGVMIAKRRLPVKYLCSFWPDDEIPAEYVEAHAREAERIRKLIESDNWFEGRLCNPDNPLYAPISQDLQPKYDWKERNRVFDGAADRAFEYARVAAEVDPAPDTALARLEYVAKLSDEYNEYGWRGDIRSGGGAWVELPDAPWKCDMVQYPMRTIVPDRLF